MIYTYLFKKDVSECSWDVAHAYEHCFCHAFFEYLSSKDVNPGTFGFLNAETFKDELFVYSSFYNKDIAKLFEEFIDINHISQDFINKSIDEIGIEDYSTYEIKNSIELNKQFELVNNEPWENVSNLNSVSIKMEESSPKSPLDKKRTARKYRDVLISFYIEKATPDENALMLRWSMIIDDIITRALSRDLTCYKTFYSPAYSIKSDAVGRTIVIRFLKNTQLKDIESRIENILKSFDIEKNISHIQDHFREYGSQQIWRDTPISYYKYTNIITSNSHIESLASLNNLSTLTEKIKVEVKNYNRVSSNLMRERLGL